MRHTRFYTAACVFCLTLTAPAYAQKIPAKALAKKTAASAAQKAPQALTNAALARQWKTAALQEARQIDKAFEYVFFKTGQAQLAHLIDLAAFRVYTEDLGVTSTLSNWWASLYEGLNIMHFGPNSQTSALTLRKKLLQNEARFKHALKKWQELKPVVLKTATPADYSLLSQANAPTRFFFEDSPSLDVFSKELASLGAGRKDAISLMANGQTEVETLYRKMMAFAHGKGAFPMKTNEVYQFLNLKKYSDQQLADLQKNLNSSECTLLRSWGWSNRSISRVIALYRSQNWAQPFNEKDFFPVVMEQYQALSSWSKSWKQAAKTDLEKARQIQQQLNTKTR